MPKKTDKKQFLSLFREMCEVSKTNLITELNQAAETGTFNFETETDRQRLFALLVNLLDVQNAEAYMKLEKLTN